MKTRRNSREISSPQKEGLLTFDQDWFALVPQGSHWVLPTVEMFHSTVGARFAGGNSGGSSSAFWFAPTAPTLCAELAYVCELSRKLPTGKEVERRNFSFFVVFFLFFVLAPVCVRVLSIAILVQGVATVAALCVLIVRPRSPAMSVPVIAEETVKGPLFKESGGGTLYRTKGPFPNRIYKHVKHEREMETLWSLRREWWQLRGSAWAAPFAYVSDLEGSIVGYVMDKVYGETLCSMAATSTWNFPLSSVIAHVVETMGAAMDVGSYPFTEHGGNVLVDKGPRNVGVTLLDVDGCVRWSPEHSELEMLKQLEVIFLNFERHPFYTKIFDMTSGDPKLRPQFQEVGQVLAACGRRG